MNTFHVKLSVEEVNTILKSLGNAPYLEVYKLVANLQKQVGEQVHSQNTKEQEENREEF